MNKYLRKTLIISASLLMFLSTGTGISNVNAKHRHYHYRSSRLYRRHQRRNYKRYKKIGKFNWKSYLYNLKTPDELASLVVEYNEYGISTPAGVKKALHRFSYNGKTIPAFDSSKVWGFIPLKTALKTIKHKHISFAKYIREEQISKGPLYEDGDWGDSAREPQFYTPSQLRHMAKINHMSIKHYKYVTSKSGMDKSLYNYTQNDFKTFLNEIHHKGRKISKYWYSHGHPTQLLLKTADRDAINDLNNQRETEGLNPLTPNPYLQSLADTVTKHQYYVDQDDDSGLKPQYKKIYDHWEKEFNNDGKIPAAASDSYYGVYMPKRSPKIIAEAENDTMQQYYSDNRMDPNYTQIGLSIGPVGGGFAEEFGTGNTSYSNPSYDDDNQNSFTTVKQKTLDDLNNDRASINESPLNEDSYLDNIAQQRSQQLVNNFSHYDNNGNPYVYDDGMDGNWAENIAYASGDSPKIAADTMNNSMFYGEEANDGGHYENIANNNNVGIGVTKSGNTYYLAEDFN